MVVHPNDCSKQAAPGVWIFRGKSVGFLMLGAIATWLIFEILMPLMDWYLAVGIASLPLVGLAAWVHFFVNGQPANYCADVLTLWIWSCSGWLYRHGGLRKPPILWVSRKYRHPSEL